MERLGQDCAHEKARLRKILPHVTPQEGRACKARKRVNTSYLQDVREPEQELRASSELTPFTDRAICPKSHPNTRLVLHCFRRTPPHHHHYITPGRRCWYPTAASERFETSERQRLWVTGTHYAPCMVRDAKKTQNILCSTTSHV